MPTIYRNGFTPQTAPYLRSWQQKYGGRLSLEVLESPARSVMAAELFRKPCKRRLCDLQGLSRSSDLQQF